MQPALYDVLMRLDVGAAKTVLRRKSVLAETPVQAASFAKDVAKDEDGALESKILVVQLLNELDRANSIAGLEQVPVKRLHELNRYVCSLNEVEMAYLRSLLTLYFEDPDALT